jgi:Ras-related protein Rab-5C
MKGLKLTLVGDSGVGKSSLLESLLRGRFSEYTDSTIGAAYAVHVREHEGSKLKFEIWDTAGQERFHSIIPMYLRGSRCVILVYDRSDIESLRSCETRWIPDIKKCFEHFQSDPPILIFLENKIDMDENPLLTDQAMKLAKENGYTYWRASAKSNQGIEDLFEYLSTKLVEEGIIVKEVPKESVPPSSLNKISSLLPDVSSSSLKRCCNY